jgi:hypothetical protein
MSDFSELCPLFETGVFSEVGFYDLKMSGVSICSNILLGSINMGSATRTAVWTFGRTVVVTKVFIRNRAAASLAQAVSPEMYHRASLCSAGTVFASFTASITTSGTEKYSWSTMTQADDQTFTSDEILGMTLATKFAASAGVFDLIVRYKEA